MKQKNTKKVKTLKKTKKLSKKPLKATKSVSKKKTAPVKVKKAVKKLKTLQNKSRTLQKKVKTAKPLKTLKKVKPIKSPKAKAIKKSSKTRYTLKELKHFKEVILNERKLILESAEANMKALVDAESGEYVGDNLTYATHMAEQGTDEMEREKNYLFVQRDEKYLGYLQEALIRIDQGTYGICIDCIDEPKYLCKTCPLIPKERLELVPITQHCIECKNLRG
jgi:RNA polymerase-binding transcription factor DksA